VPFLIGGYGRRVVRIAARHADIYQFTGLTHGEDGRPTAGGFALDLVRERADWLSHDAAEAGDRDSEIERSALVQATDIGPDASDRIESLAERFAVAPAVIEETPFVLIGSLQQVVDKLERLRADLAISHYVIRDPEGMAPLVDALAGR
jgi:alkanesulfonate monooxygenase SsuD/methylene tetrahydromethanopterin reductase-like flavin-dependent oxidoreductase (luciferase family)